jgi:type II secretory ATPase GspE/PulE/Tfp pilus assembly ATPase PilB-like protein/DNA-binding response OmpR family regulator
MTSYSGLFSEQSSEETDNKTFSEDFSTTSQYGILFLDDEKQVLKSLQRCFRKENYHVFTSQNHIEAFELLKNNTINLVISDFLMPNMNGADFLRQVRKKHPEIIRIMLTGHADTNAVMTAIEEGAVYKFILKPWNNDDLRVTVALALEQFELQRKNKKLLLENNQQKKDLSKLNRMATSNRGQLLVSLNKKGLINDHQIQKILKIMMSSKSPPIKILLRQGWVTEKQIRKLIKSQFFIEEIRLNEFHIDPAVISLIPASFCKKQLVLPIKQVGMRVTLVMADPLDEGILENLRFSSGLNFNVVMANCLDIENKLIEVFGESLDMEDIEAITSIEDPMDSIEIVIEEDEDIELSELLAGTSEPPAIRLANAIIMEGIRLGSSDIHIQPTAKHILIRYRIDGVLHDKIQAPLALLMPLVSRIKIMAELDITERRRPQDGRLTVKSPLKIIDLRLSTMPTINGEKIVMRLLDRNSSMVPLIELGFNEKQLKQLEYINTKPQGIILATGPTGSGKTTTLYSLLKTNASSEKNYITIEDPVEYYMDRAGQVMVRDKIGLGFSTVLRAVLRQDPDTILLGEIRDFETANIAFQAALTGHAVFSTIHTNSALATLARLFDLGLRPYIVASALEAIIAQRLVRRLCQHCKRESSPEASILNLLGPYFTEDQNKFFESEGCDECHGTGLHGRIGIYEILVFDEVLREAITNELSFVEISETAKKQGMTTLMDDARTKVGKGLVSAKEVLRVFGAQAFY